MFGYETIEFKYNDKLLSAITTDKITKEEIQSIKELLAFENKTIPQLIITTINYDKKIQKIKELIQTWQITIDILKDPKESIEYAMTDLEMAGECDSEIKRTIKTELKRFKKEIKALKNHLEELKEKNGGIIE